MLALKKNNGVIWCQLKVYMFIKDQCIISLIIIAWPPTMLIVIIVSIWTGIVVYELKVRINRYSLQIIDIIFYFNSLKGLTISYMNGCFYCNNRQILFFLPAVCCCLIDGPSKKPHWRFVILTFCHFDLLKLLWYGNLKDWPSDLMWILNW